MDASENQGEKSALPQQPREEEEVKQPEGLGLRGTDLGTRVWSVIFPGQCGPDIVGEGD